MHPIDELFTAGLRVHGGDGRRYVRSLGEIPLPTGRLVLADPSLFGHPPPAAVAVSSPKISLQLATVRLFGHEEVCALRIDLGRVERATWRRTSMVVGVDGACACVAPLEALEWLREGRRAERASLRVWERFTRRPWLAPRIGPRPGWRIVAFQTHDDGGYRLWEGRVGGDVRAYALPLSRTALSKEQRAVLRPAAT